MTDGRFRVNRPTVAAETVDGEVLMIHLGTGNYYSLRGTGAAIWDAVEAGVSARAVAEGIEPHFDHPGDTDAAAVVDAFLAELTAEGLIVPAERDDDGPRQPWNPLACGPLTGAPELEKFTDMQHLILLDPVHEVDRTEGWPTLRADT